jgi:hypothetical protein
MIAASGLEIRAAQRGKRSPRLKSGEAARLDDRVLFRALRR